MTLSDTRAQLMEQIRQHIMRVLPSPGEKKSGPLFYIHRTDNKCSNCCITKPLCALTVQGNKHISMGELNYWLYPGHTLVTCVDLPTTSYLMNVSQSKPFLALYFYLDISILTQLIADAANAGWFPSQASTRAAVCGPDEKLLSGFLRLGRAVEKALDERILAPLVLRELHYLLLTGPQGQFLYELYSQGAPDFRILEAINCLKHNLNAAVSMNELARVATMSVSSLHRHFKNITGFSPLQYHKQLRLYEAQRLMLVENERADMAARAVGYESITQFNREYKRMFGQPPHRDINSRKRKNNSLAQGAPAPY